MKHDDARKILRSRGGLKITMDDAADRERFVIETSGGQKFLLQNGPGKIEVSDGNATQRGSMPAGLRLMPPRKLPSTPAKSRSTPEPSR